MIPRLVLAGVLCALVVMSVRAADPAPVMTVSMTVAGQLRDPQLAPRIGVDVPVVLTWTLQDAPADAAWYFCAFPRSSGIMIDRIFPEPLGDPRLGRFPPETRQVTLELHGTGTVADYVQVEVASCAARLANGRTPSAMATMRLQPIYPNTIHLPRTEQRAGTPAYPAP